MEARLGYVNGKLQWALRGDFKIICPVTNTTFRRFYNISNIEAIDEQLNLERRLGKTLILTELADSE